jgi:SAM-dependent methyltransferase
MSGMPCSRHVHYGQKLIIPNGQFSSCMSIFDEAYSGVPNWEIGRPQREFVTLEKTGEIRGDVLDVGCGTGENALFLAERDHEVWGVDSVPRAIELAQEKARERDLSVTFLVQDALDMENLSQTFDTIIDSGLFHALSDPDRLRFVCSLITVLRPGGTYLMLALSDLEPGENGPRRVTQQEIRATFEEGWRINWIRAAVFEGRGKPAGYLAWLSSITRV